MQQNKKILLEYATALGFKVHKDSRTPNCLASVTGKIFGGIDGIRERMRDALGDCSVEAAPIDIAKRISGKYDSYVITTPLDTFYLRSIVGSSGVLADKDLTPSKLGLTGRSMDLESLRSALLPPLEKFHPKISSVCIQLFDSIGETDQTPELLGDLSPSDAAKVGKDFGEVLLAKWYLLSGFDSVEFPKEENLALTDFVVGSDMRELRVSAKFGVGANASVKSIIPARIDCPSAEMRALNSVAHDGILDGLLNAARILDTPEYVSLQETISDEPTLDNISELVRASLAAGDRQGFLNGMSKFYSCISSPSSGIPNESSIPKIVALGEGNYHHPIMYAISVSLAHRFNTDSRFLSAMNEYANSIDAEQAYLNIGKSAIRVHRKRFSESKFKFMAGAYAYKADNVRMKVKMI